MGKKGKAKEIDSVIGNNIKAVRMMSGMSQQVLADGIGVTFQQVQKYEKGKNRVSAGTLLKIAQFMSVPPMSLFEDVATETKATISPQTIFSREVLDLIHAFNQIKDERIRASVRNFLKSVSAHNNNEED